MTFGLSKKTAVDVEDGVWCVPEKFDEEIYMCVDLPCAGFENWAMDAPEFENENGNLIMATEDAGYTEAESSGKWFCNQGKFKIDCRTLVFQTLKHFNHLLTFFP